jgi:molybdenum cofactor cytidylyltransferase
MFVLATSGVQYSGTMRESSAAALPGLAAIVLAAGGSSRLGKPKQLLRRGVDTLLARAVACARAAAGSGIVVVLGAEHLKLRLLLRRLGPDIRIAYNGGWNSGMSGSLRTGLRHIDPAATAVLIVLVDQACLKPGDCRRLAARWRAHPGRPAAADYGDGPGAPAIFPLRFRRALHRVAGDTGARGVLRQLGELTRVSMPRAAIDIDVAQDLRWLRP